MNKYPDLFSLKDWFIEFSQKPLIIAGPCSAESENQVLATAKEIAISGKVKAFRAGIWKPRTRPGSFEGVGIKGLKWLQHIKKETGMLTVVEVANPEHVEHALRHKVDILWIGARTTSNPFSVQELANSLQGTSVPVMVKNPVNPDLNLWIGAIERFYHAGIKKIAAVHRGFYPFENTPLRNIPKWEIIIELKRQINNLPIITDPSHIAGDIKYIESISQKAIDLDSDGLMIECHCDPKNALSDANQQLTPKQLNELLQRLVFRNETSDNELFVNLLEQYREQIDSIDNQLLELLGQRMKITENIGKYKSENNVTILQLRRWEKIISTRTELGNKLGLTDRFILKLLQIIHSESIRIQEDIINKNQNIDNQF